MYSAVGFGQKPQLGFPGAVTGRLRALQDLAADRAGDDELRLRPVGVAVPDRACVHRVRARRRADPGDDARSPSSARPPAAACACCRRRPRRRCARCCSWRRRPAAPRRRRRSWATRSAARPAPRTSRKAKAMPARNTAPGSSAWRRSTNPRIIVAVMVDEPCAGKYFGGDVAAPVFSEVVQQTLRMMGVQPDLDVKPQIVARECRPRGELLMAMRSSHRPTQAARLAASLRGAARCAPTAAGSGPATVHRLAGRGDDGARATSPPRSRRGAAPAWSRPTASRPSASTTSASPRCAGLKAAAGPIAAAFFGEPERAAATCVAVHRHQRQDLDGVVAGAGADARSAMPLRRRRHARHRRAAAAARRATVGDRPDDARPGGCCRRAFRRFADAGVAACAIEASSIGIVEHRLDGTRDRRRAVHQLHAGPPRLPRRHGRLLGGQGASCSTGPACAPRSQHRRREGLRAGRQRSQRRRLDLLDRVVPATRRRACAPSDIRYDDGGLAFDVARRRASASQVADRGWSASTTSPTCSA